MSDKNFVSIVMKTATALVVLNVGVVSMVVVVVMVVKIVEMK